MERSCDENNNGNRQKKILSQREIEAINRIINGIREIQGRIVELEEIEVDFDNERNSSFLELHNCRKELIELYHEGCAIKGIKPDAGRPYLMNKNLEITGNSFVDRVINNCINEDHLNIPQFDEIFECVQFCNDKLKLEMSKAVEKSYAEIAYAKVVEALKRMRQHDFHSNYATIYAETQDPAKLSRPLFDKLMANELLGQRNLNKILDNFVQKQHETLIAQAAKKRRSAPVSRRNRPRRGKKTPARADDDEETSESGDSDANLSETHEDSELINLPIPNRKSEEFDYEVSAPHFAVSTLVEQRPGPSRKLINSSRVNTGRGNYKKKQVIDESRGETSIDSIAEYFKNQPDLTVKTEDEAEEVQTDEEEKVKRRERCLVM